MARASKAPIKPCATSPLRWPLPASTSSKRLSWNLGQPDLTGATALLIARGAKRIVVIPYFLTLGTHMQRDLPRLAREASQRPRRHRNADHFAAGWPSRAGSGSARSRQRSAGRRIQHESRRFWSFTTSRPKCATSCSKSPKSQQLHFKPGQFVSFNETLNGKKITRPYSIVSLPDGNRFELCLNLVHEGVFHSASFRDEAGRFH